MFLPLTLACGLLLVGGDSRMSDAVLTMVYSLYCSEIFPPTVGKFVVPVGGVSLISTGGMVSFGPPLGAVVVLAQEWLDRQAPTKRSSRMTVMAILLMII